MARPSSALALLLLAAGLLPSVVQAAPPQGGPSIQLQRGKDTDAFLVTGLAPAVLDTLRKQAPDAEAWPQVFAVYVARGNEVPTGQPPVLGSYRVTGDTLRFEPRFPLQPGVRYRALLHVARLPGATAGPALSADFALPKAPAVATTVVEQVYPSADRLPENLLKFYLHFSAPMSRGQAYRHVHLLDAAGKEVELAFLELGEELWDPQGKRLTLLFDPGRIKRGLKPREEVGPSLEEGKSYTLVIDRGWEDVAGNPLRETFRKPFQVGPPDEQQPDPKTWKLEPPRASTRQPLQVTFPEPLDHALLGGAFQVRDGEGGIVPGTVAIAGKETIWRFTPTRPWQAGSYQLVVSTALEDLGANSIERPFELDIFRPIQRQLTSKTVELPFTVP